MRWKIIIVNAAIVFVVGFVSYVLLATGLGDLVEDNTRAKHDAERALRAANARLAVDALRLERWLAEQAATEAVRGVFTGGTTDARANAATASANKIRDAAVADEGFAKMAPSVVVLVDEAGVALGRNGSNLMRGDKIAEAYPSLTDALKTGHTSSDIWLNRERQEQLLASYAPVRDEAGKVLGAVIVGTPLNDERMSRTSELTSGRALFIGVPTADNLEVVAKAASADAAITSAIGAGSVAKGAAAVLGAGNLTVLEGGPPGTTLAAAPLEGYGKASRAVILAAVPSSLVPNLTALLWPIIAVTALGILLVIVGGVLLGNYMSRPIAEMEEGLLAIINGRADLRFEIEHPELGGLVTRINSLLNAFMDVPETDEDGRPSVPADARNFE